MTSGTCEQVLTHASTAHIAKQNIIGQIGLSNSRQNNHLLPINHRSSSQDINHLSVKWSSITLAFNQYQHQSNSSESKQDHHSQYFMWNLQNCIVPHNQYIRPPSKHNLDEASNKRSWESSVRVHHLGLEGSKSGRFIFRSVVEVIPMLRLVPFSAKRYMILHLQRNQSSNQR